MIDHVQLVLYGLLSLTPFLCRVTAAWNGTIAAVGMCEVYSHHVFWDGNMTSLEAIMFLIAGDGVAVLVVGQTRTPSRERGPRFRTKCADPGAV